MASGSDTAPAWLFSFVDLAFLLLIALTQVGGGPRAVDLGEIVVPRVNEEATSVLSAGARERWQLRIHPPSAADPGPFELLAPGSSGAAGAHLATATLREQLGRLLESKAGKPLLAPHQDSRSQDLLDAIALIEERWPDGRRAAVSPVVAKP
jgi:hypothetical protein